MKMNASPAYIQFSNIYLSEQAASFVNSCPRDDAELIVQDAIDSLLFKIIGDGDSAADFSPLLADNVPVYAMHTQLEDIRKTFDVTVVADFRNNGIRYTERPEVGFTEAFEIDACIYIASPAEMDKMLQSWNRSSGNAPKFVS
jgi:hypothetical protein